MKKLTETFLFRVLDDKNGLTEQLQAASSPGNALPLGRLEYQLDVVRRRFNYPIKERIFQDLRDEMIVPVFNKEALRLPVYVPAVGVAGRAGPVAFANLTPYGRQNDKAGELEIDTRKLFAILQTSYFMRRVASTEWNTFAMNSTIMKDGSAAYSKLVTKVLDKMFGVGMNKVLADSVRFTAAKFFAVGMMGRTDGPQANSIAYASCIGGTTRSTVMALENGLPEGRYSDVNSMVGAIATMDGMKGLTTRSFLENWMRMYNEASAFALEYFPFFLHTAFSAVVGAHIVNDYVVDPLIGQESLSLYNEMSRLLR